jgi:hypothetical protein
MGGRSKTSTHVVTTKAPQSPCSKLKTRRNASAATPTLSGHHHMAIIMLVIVVRFCSTCLAKGTSQTKEQAMRFAVTSGWGLVFKEMAGGS